MNDYMKHNIINYAWHQFLYGYDNQDRKNSLLSMVRDYPVKFDNEDAVAIYVDDFSLPNLEIGSDVNYFQVETVAREYLSIVIVDKIVEDSMRMIEIEKLEERMKSFIANINRIMINPGMEEIYSISELASILKDTKKFYYEEYIKLIETGKFQGNIFGLRLSFMDLNFFIKYYKKALNMNKHFSVLIDNHNTSTLVSQKAVNGIVTKRCTGDISMKVVTDPGDWKVYYDLTGQLAEVVHDYSGMELDDSYSKYLKKIRDKRIIG